MKIFHQFFFISLSLLIVTFSQPDWSTVCCVLTSMMSYALFWKGMLYLPRKRERFGLACIWFAGVQVIHLNWFTADKYVGGYIFVFLLLLLTALGACFGLLSLAVQSPQVMSVWRIFGIAGAWSLFEWGRLFVLSGFSWNPIGLSLTGTLVGMQLVSAFGIFGLTFWVLVANLFALKCLKFPMRLGPCGLWMVIAALPYFYGVGELSFHKKQMISHSSSPLSVLLVQTSLYPEQKGGWASDNPFVFSPLDQWRRILMMLKSHKGKEIDLIAFSEAVVPYGTDIPLYTIADVARSFEDILEVRFPYKEPEKTKVGNAYWAQAIANYFQADTIIGLEDAEKVSDLKVYNAAFLFRPNAIRRERYEKRVLVPLGEYIPFHWCKKFLARYGIQDSLTAGQEAKVFDGKKVPIGLSICYEETYGHLMRENRLKGAGILVNLTNDAWYPQSRLPMVHYLHGRIRSVEGGLPVVRASNTGVTCAIDSLGRTVGLLDYENEKKMCPADALHVELSTYHYPTLYSRYGDQLIVWFSLLSIFVAISAAFFPLLPKPLEKI